MTLERVHEIVEKADTDGNGTVNQREYLGAVAADIMPTMLSTPSLTASSTSSPRSPGRRGRAGRGAAGRRRGLGRWERAASCRISRRTTSIPYEMAAAAAPAAELVQASARRRKRLEVVSAPCVGGDATTRGGLRLGRR